MSDTVKSVEHHFTEKVVDQVDVGKRILFWRNAYCSSYSSRNASKCPERHCHRGDASGRRER
jgi:hypothetical protein